MSQFTQGFLLFFLFSVVAMVGMVQTVRRSRREEPSAPILPKVLPFLIADGVFVVIFAFWLMNQV